MADVIARLKLESGEYDSKIKRAVSGLQNMEQECRRVDGTLAILEKDQKQYVQSLGQMQTVSNTVRGKIGELSGAFVELRAQYNRLTEEEKRGDFGKALSKSLDDLKNRIRDSKKELSEIQSELNGGSGGGIFSKMGDKLGGAMSVFAGNLMTKATMEVANLGSEMAEMVKQGVEMAKAGEGIRIAFERLGNGKILDGLREATHGTVTDIELMKAAVKFNDFKLPIEELGVMLAYAQQKAKDTGQSVEYMVDSIVTGLGRKSLLILDNLGLSAAEIKDKMAETGDMTKAVGAIIREQMSKAGDYVETAADRAAQAHVSLQNKMEELGRLYQPLQEASNTFWTSMKIGILDVVAGPLAKLLNGLTEAGSQMKMLQNANGGQNGERTRVNSQLDTLKNVRRSGSDFMVNRIYSKQVEDYNRQIIDIDTMLKQSEGVDKGSILKKASQQFGQDFFSTHELKRYQEALRTMRDQYVSGAKDIIAPPKVETPKVEPPKTGGTGGSGTTTKDVYVPAKGSIDAQVEKVRELTKQWSAATDQAGRDGYKKQLDEAQGVLDQMRGKVKTLTQEMATGESGLTPKAVGTYQNMLQESMKGMEYGSVDFTETFANSLDVNALSSLLTTSMKQGIDLTKEQLAGGTTMQDLWNQILSGENIDDSVWQELVKIFNKKIEEVFGEDGAKLKIVFDVDDKQIKNLGKKTTDDAEKTQKAWGLAATSVSNLGNALAGIEDPGAKAAGTVIKAIADIALGFANASKTASILGPWGWLAWMAAGMAAMATTISTVHSLTGFAEGGIVDGSKGGFIQGNTYSGDQIGNVRLNAGELVLNRAQQGVLADALDNEGGGAISSTPYVTGEQIYLGLNNYLKGAGYGQLVTSKG